MPYAYHQTKEFKILVSRLCAYFEAKAIPVVTESKETIYSLCQTGQKKTKNALMQSLVLQFPELCYCYYKEQRNNSKYYIKLFEAVAAAALEEHKQ